MEGKTKISLIKLTSTWKDREKDAIEKRKRNKIVFSSTTLYISLFSTKL